MIRLLLALALLSVGLGASAQDDLQVQQLGTYATGLFGEGAAEIVAYDAATQRAFFVNAGASQVQALDLTDPEALTLAFSITVSGGAPTSVAVRNGIVAVAVEAETVTDPGEVQFYSTAGDALGSVTVGALPDALAFSADGRYVVVANEGEPAGGVDPEGSISIVDLQGGVAAATVATVGFTDFNEGGSRRAELELETATKGLLLDPASASVAQDLEPENVAVYGTTAYVSLQEANAVAVVDLASGTLTGVYGLLFKNFNFAGPPRSAGLDPSDRDGGVDIRTVPVVGAFQPDGLAAFEDDGTVYVLSANEGDARDGDDARVADLTLDPAAFPNAAALQAEAALGRLHVRPSAGDTDGDGDQDLLVAFGGRSFTTFQVSASGLTAVSESFDEFEQVTAERYPDHFNATNDNNDSFDDRSDDKGPEPEGVAVGMVDGRRYAFVGLEQIGGVMIYDVTDPLASTFVAYVNNRDFSVDVQLGNGSSNPAAGDLGPEGLAFISATDSPTGQALLLVANEVSGTVTVYGLGQRVTARSEGPEGSVLRLVGAVPNPSRTPAVVFSLEAPADVRLVVFDALGREVSRTERALGAGADLRLAPDVSGLAPGVYLYRIEATAGTETDRQSGRLVLAR